MNNTENRILDDELKCLGEGHNLIKIKLGNRDDFLFVNRRGLLSDHEMQGYQVVATLDLQAAHIDPRAALRIMGGLISNLKS